MGRTSSILDAFGDEVLDVLLKAKLPTRQQEPLNRNDAGARELHLETLGPRP